MKKTAFTIFYAVVLVVALVFGVLGGEAVVSAFLSDCCAATPHPKSVGEELLAFLIFTTSVILSVGGCVFLVVLPAAFVFPNASKPFTWQNNPAWASRVLAWYSKGLARYAEAIKHDA